MPNDSDVTDILGVELEQVEAKRSTVTVLASGVNNTTTLH